MNDRKFVDMVLDHIAKRVETEDLNPHEERVLMDRYEHILYLLKENERWARDYHYCHHYDVYEVSNRIAGEVGLHVVSWKDPEYFRPATQKDYFDFFKQYVSDGGCCYNVNCDLDIDCFVVAKKDCVVGKAFGRDSFNILVPKGINVVGAGSHIEIFDINDTMSANRVCNYNDIAKVYYDKGHPWHSPTFSHYVEPKRKVFFGWLFRGTEYED